MTIDQKPSKSELVNRLLDQRNRYTSAVIDRDLEACHDIGADGFETAQQLRDDHDFDRDAFMAALSPDVGPLNTMVLKPHVWDTFAKDPSGRQAAFLPFTYGFRHGQENPVRVDIGGIEQWVVIVPNRDVDRDIRVKDSDGQYNRVSYDQIRPHPDDCTMFCSDPWDRMSDSLEAVEQQDDPEVVAKFLRASEEGDTFQIQTVDNPSLHFEHYGPQTLQAQVEEVREIGSNRKDIWLRTERHGVHDDDPDGYRVMTDYNDTADCWNTSISAYRDTGSGGQAWCGHSEVTKVN